MHKGPPFLSLFYALPAMNHCAENLRRLMARDGLTLRDVIERTELDDLTGGAILSGANKPHARTVHKLATGLSVSTDELFQDPSLLAYRLFDRQTNPLVETVIADQADLFAGWAHHDFDELYSRFGTGGAMTSEGIVEVVQAMNRKREVHEKVALLLETGQAEVLCGMVDVLYQTVVDRS